jgi:plasmid stabilization system protein ParE
MNVVWRRTASRDMERIHAHSAHFADPVHAYETLATIRTEVNHLVDHPWRGPANDFPVGTRSLIVTHRRRTYRVIYRIRERKQEIVILRVRDTRQRGG